MITAQLLGQALIAAGNVLLGAQQTNQVQAVATHVQTNDGLGVGLTHQPVVQQPVVTQPQAAQNIDADAITALIQPHIGNDAIKADLGVAMRSLGINGLPETQPHQYGTLYSLFQGVLAKYGIGGAGAAQPQQAQNTSII